MNIMRKLKHPNLVSMLRVITKEEPRAIVLEYLVNGDLATWLTTRGDDASSEDLVFILYQVASGMAELEAAGIGRWRGRKRRRGRSAWVP